MKILLKGKKLEKKRTVFSILKELVVKIKQSEWQQQGQTQGCVD